MSDLKIEFGKRLKAIRENRGLTQEKLAELAQTSRDTIRNIECGLHAPRFGLFERILRTLQAHPREFFEFSWPGPT